MECEIGWEVHPTGRVHSRNTPPLTVPIRLGQKTITALLDTGSSVSLIRAHLVPTGRATLCYTDMVGVYRQGCRWTVVHMVLTYNNTTYNKEILKVDALPFPVLFERDAPAFGPLLRSALPHLSAVLNDDEQQRPSRKQADEPDLEAGPWEADDEFLEAQGSDPSLDAVQNNLAAAEGQVLDARRAARLPRFKKVRGRLWRIVGPEQGGGVTCRQLVVPRPYQERVLQHAHCHPWSGHQGWSHTLCRLLSAFFCFSLSQDAKRFCRDCEQCQRATKRGPPKVPLESMSLLEQPFEHIAMDFIGPLPSSAC